jgi:hypothetical protein
MYLCSMKNKALFFTVTTEPYRIEIYVK